MANPSPEHKSLVKTAPEQLAKGAEAITKKPDRHTPQRWRGGALSE